MTEDDPFEELDLTPQEFVLGMTAADKFFTHLDNIEDQNDYNYVAFVFVCQMVMATIRQCVEENESFVEEMSLSLIKAIKKEAYLDIDILEYKD